MRTKLAWGAALGLLAFAMALLGEWSRYAPVRARARGEPWREAPGWKGTVVRAWFAVPSPVLKAFAGDPPAPDERKELFGDFLPPSSRHRCLGWFGTIESVTPTADGYEASVSMMARLPGTAFCSAAATETWQISPSGEARCIRATGKPGALFVD